MPLKTQFDQNIFHNAIKNNASKKDDYCNVDNDEEALGMRAMWRAVITQALMDAASESKKFYCFAEKARARAWLKGDSEGFIEVCFLAELDPEYVKAQAKLAIARKCRWRNDFKSVRNHAIIPAI